MSTATLRTLAAEWSKAGQASMDHLTKSSGFLRVAEAISASHGGSHKYKRVDALPTFSVIEPGGSTTDTTVNENVETLDLKIVRSQQSEPSDIVDDFPAGKAEYFNRQMPVYEEAFGQKASTVIFYGTNSTFGDVKGFTGLHQLAKAYGNVIQQGGASGSRTSIFAVRFRTGDNGCGVVYDPNIVSTGFMMNSEVLNDGKKVMEVTNTTGQYKKLVYQLVHSGKMSFLSSSSYDVAAYTQIQDAADDRPTADNMDLLLDYVRADGAEGMTYLFANRTGLRLLRKLKDDKLEMIPEHTNYDRRVFAWNGYPIVLDENILDTETTALD